MEFVVDRAEIRTQVVTITKPDASSLLGFNHDDREVVTSQVVIKDITPGSVAAASGLLFKKDVILEVLSPLPFTFKFAPHASLNLHVRSMG